MFWGGLRRIGNYKRVNLEELYNLDGRSDSNSDMG